MADQMSGALASMPMPDETGPAGYGDLTGGESPEHESKEMQLLQQIADRLTKLEAAVAKLVGGEAAEGPESPAGAATPFPVR